jgi:aspartyl-tRNA(Asn)/glutamyl-tRNA(Gln) amidotransferase subunit C
MKITAGDVRHMARLAELAVDDEDLDRIASEMDAIVAMVEELADVDDESLQEPLVVGPQQVKLRPDTVAAIPMVSDPLEQAPEMVQGLYLVPKLEGLAEE